MAPPARWLVLALIFPLNVFGSYIDESHCGPGLEVISMQNPAPAGAAGITKWDRFRKGETITIPTTAGFQRPVRELIHKEVALYGKRMQLPQEQIDLAIYRIETAFNEIYTNAFDHGNKGDPRKQIYLGFQMRDGKVTILVGDENGEFYDPNDPAHPVQRDGLRARTIHNMDKEEVRAQITAQRRAKNHAPARSHVGGFGVAITEAFTENVEYKPNTRGKKTIGTSVSMSWDLNFLRVPTRAREAVPTN